MEVVQYLAALAVIVIHSGKLSSHEYLHFFIHSMVARIVVPFFFVTAGFLYRERTISLPAYKKVYFRKQIKQYLLWSILYLPYGLLYVRNLQLPPLFYVVGLVVGFLYSGIWYHLWYIPALLTGLWLVDKTVKKTNYGFAFLLFGLLFTLGATETYSNYISGTAIESLYMIYQSVLFTTRNGLFFSPIFVLCGFCLSDFRSRSLFQASLRTKLGLCAALLLLEGSLIFSRPGDDKNFFFAHIPLSLFLVATLIQIPSSRLSLNTQLLRSITRYLYFLHPLFLEIIISSAPFAGLPDIKGFPLFLATLTLTKLCIFVILRLKNISFRAVWQQKVK